MNYPVYRKYNGADTWFKIISETEFMEVKRVGSKLLRSHIIAVQFPEKQFIRDMLALHEQRWVEPDTALAEDLFNE